MKPCSKCGEAKPLGGFSRDRAKSDGLRPECRACVSARVRRRYVENAEAERERKRRYRAENADAVREYDRRRHVENREARLGLSRRYQVENRETISERRRRHYIENREVYRERNLRRYGITSDQFEALLAAQDGRCAICGTTEPGGQGAFHVDHDHDHCQGCPECVRGLLCASCNCSLERRLADPDPADPDWLESARIYVTDPPAQRSKSYA